MTDQTKIILIAIFSILAILIMVILIANVRKANLKKEFEEINVAFNQIKTVPLAFKLNKAQAMAKRNDEEDQHVKEYYSKYEEAQKHIDEIAEAMENIDDFLAVKDYKSAKAVMAEVTEAIDNSEKEVAAIDKFLERFADEETGQRDSVNVLKEEFRKVKLYINENSTALSIAYEALEKKIEIIEELFSSCEEFMYVNNYKEAEDCLENLTTLINELKNDVLNIPSLIEENKGLIPSLLDELARQYALARQRGVYTEHLRIDEEMVAIQGGLNNDTKKLIQADITDVENNNYYYKERLNTLLKNLDDESEKFSRLKGNGDQTVNNINELKQLHYYVKQINSRGVARFGLDDVSKYLREASKHIDEYNDAYLALSKDISSNDVAASELSKRTIELLNKTSEDKNKLLSYKQRYDKCLADEQRANSQLIKLQVVLNEVEVKVLEYRLPTIADSYAEDLNKGREQINLIKNLLNEKTLNLLVLNKNLDEAIDFIYKFYNNVNNIVGMAIMVENAIVFGNKYRSSYPEVERDLSKAEFSYLNGEYTKALTMAIACMEKLFPNNNDTTYLENA